MECGLVNPVPELHWTIARTELCAQFHNILIESDWNLRRCCNLAASSLIFADAISQSSVKDAYVKALMAVYSWSVDQESQPMSAGNFWTIKIYSNANNNYRHWSTLLGKTEYELGNASRPFTQIYFLSQAMNHDRERKIEPLNLINIEILFFLTYSYIFDLVLFGEKRFFEFFSPNRAFKIFAKSCFAKSTDYRNKVVDQKVFWDTPCRP